MLGKGGKVIVQGSFITAAFGHGCLQVVGHNGQRGSAEVMQGILTGGYQVFLLLAHDGFDISQLAAWKDGHKDFNRDNLTALHIHNGKLVTRKINEELVTRLVFQVHHRVAHAYMALDETVKTGKTVAVRMLGDILLVQFAAAHAFMTQALTVRRQKGFQDGIP